jgi:hypothetical protein
MDLVCFSSGSVGDIEVSFAEDGMDFSISKIDKLAVIPSGSY